MLIFEEFCFLLSVKMAGHEMLKKVVVSQTGQAKAYKI
jgi:hypothetical protein